MRLSDATKIGKLSRTIDLLEALDRSAQRINRATHYYVAPYAVAGHWRRFRLGRNVVRIRRKTERRTASGKA